MQNSAKEVWNKYLTLVIEMDKVNMKISLCVHLFSALWQVTLEKKGWSSFSDFILELYSAFLLSRTVKLNLLFLYKKQNKIIYVIWLTLM